MLFGIPRPNRAVLRLVLLHEMVTELMSEDVLIELTRHVPRVVPRDADTVSVGLDLRFEPLQRAAEIGSHKREAHDPRQRVQNDCALTVNIASERSPRLTDARGRSSIRVRP